MEATTTHTGEIVELYRNHYPRGYSYECRVLTDAGDQVYFPLPQSILQQARDAYEIWLGRHGTDPTESLASHLFGNPRGFPGLLGRRVRIAHAGRVGSHGRLPLPVRVRFTD